MAGRGSSKWHTERARREKQAAKKERKDLRAAEPTAEVARSEMSQADVLQALADLHASYADGDVTLDDFEVRKEQLVEQLMVD
jgi:hypothetical protein